MKRALILNGMGEILHTLDSVDEAEELIEELDYQEICRTHNNGDTNIMVSEY